MDQDAQLYKSLNQCNQDIRKLGFYMYHVGTTCDTKKLRSKLRSLHQRIMKNIYFQELSITKYMKIANANDQEKLEHLICFTLTSLSYLETLMEKLSVLYKIFPKGDDLASNYSVNLGYDDGILYESDDQDFKVSATEKNSYTDEAYNFLNEFHQITKNIEDMDKNLLRFNVKKEANEFLEKIIDINAELDGYRILLNSSLKKNRKKKK